jgi:xanthine dehydrogenase YagR molybdenum-binding subunit
MADALPKAADAHAINQNRQGLIGKSLDRLEGPLKTSGKATYSYEYKHSGQAAYGFIVEGEAAKAKIVSIHTADAEAVPGVLAVITHKNAPPLAGVGIRLWKARYDREEPFLHAAETRYFGEPIALVVAESYEIARHAASLIKATYEKAKDAKFELKAHVKDAYKPWVVNAGYRADHTEGDFEKAFSEAPVKIDATYHVAHRHNMPMEPQAAVAEWNGDKLTIYTPQQIPASAQSTIAKTFKLSKENVRIFTPYIGGGFGSKVPIHAQAVLAALGAKVVNRPVKVVFTRQQMFAGTNHRPEADQRMRIGANQDGLITSIGHEVHVHTSFHDEFVEQIASYSHHLYEAKNRLHTHRAVALDLPAPDIMRAPGEEPGSYAMECGMDELAHALGMDPIDLRIKNEPEKDPGTRKPHSSRHLVECLKEGAQRFGWDKRAQQPRSVTDGQWLVGMGVAAATFPTFLRPSEATLILSPKNAVVQMSATDIGTGTLTVMTQLTAEILGLPIERVRVDIGDTQFPPAAGSGGSFGAASAGTAILIACRKAAERLAAAAVKDRQSPLYNADVKGAYFSEGKLVIGDKSEPIEGLISKYTHNGFSVNGAHKGGASESGFSSHVFGAQFAEVGVDRDTGEIRVRRMLGVFASGRILNEKTARSQLIGGMIMGIGSGILEESVIDKRDGSFVNRDLAEYHVPVHADIPDMDAIMLPEQEDKANPLGIKGLGEVGIVGAGAAVANAIFNATGVRVRSFPVTLDKLFPELAPSA